MPDSKWGGERGRHDVYGPTPAGEPVGHNDHEFQQLIAGGEQEVLVDKLAIDAITMFIKNGEPEVDDQVVKRAYTKRLLSEVIANGEFAIGNNVETNRFGLVNRRVQALRQTDAKTNNSTTTPPRRYHRA